MNGDTMRKSQRENKCLREGSLLRADGIKPESVRWVWYGWLAAGRFHVLAEQPGPGKMTIALAFAAEQDLAITAPSGGVLSGYRSVQYG